MHQVRRNSRIFTDIFCWRCTSSIINTIGRSLSLGSSKFLRLDADSEMFEMFIKTPIRYGDSIVDIVVEDILGPLTLGENRTERDVNLALLSYSFNLNPSMCHQIGLEKSEWERVAPGKLDFVQKRNKYVGGGIGAAMQTGSAAKNLAVTPINSNAVD